MSKPKRAQRKRTKGWRKPEGAVDVTRPGMFGNPFNWKELEGGKRQAVDLFESWLKGGDGDGVFTNDWERNDILANLPELRGKDLMCWCPLDQPCHADVLLELANGEIEDDG